MSKPTKTITANKEQAESIERILDWLTAPYVADPFFVLDGPAGSGKSYVLGQIAEAYAKSSGKLLNTAPTNKAAKVIRKLTGQACTTFSALGLRMDTKGAVKELAASERGVDLSDYDGLTVDEGGMVSMPLYHHLQQATIINNMRVLFLGDKYQLPPVGEKESRIWTRPQRASLLTVERHDNTILDLVTRIRTQMDKLVMSIDVKSANDGNEGVWKVGKGMFKEQIIADAIAGKFSDTDSTKVIAWRNVTVQNYNNIIRRAIFGPGVGAYEIGERLIAASPCMVGKEMLLATDDECAVEGIVESRHPMSPEFQTIELKCRTEEGSVIRLLVCHPASQQAYDNACQSLAHAAQQNPALWKKFWKLKELFHEVRYAYAITAHRAQGSTYENVYVDYMDILLNRERREAFQCLYVASSRPTTRLIMA